MTTGTYDNTCGPCRECSRHGPHADERKEKKGKERVDAGGRVTVRSPREALVASRRGGLPLRGTDGVPPADFHIQLSLYSVITVFSYVFICSVMRRLLAARNSCGSPCGRGTFRFRPVRGSSSGRATIMAVCRSGDPSGPAFAYFFAPTAVTTRWRTTKARIIRPTTMVVHSAGTPKSEVSGSMMERTRAPRAEPRT